MSSTSPWEDEPTLVESGGPLTQAEEIAYWEGWDSGRSRQGYGSDCKYQNTRLQLAWNIGHGHGAYERTGKPWTFPTKI